MIPAYLRLAIRCVGSAAFGALLLEGPACNQLDQGSGDAGTPPVIDALTLSPTADVGTDGTYDINGTISFSSPSGSAVSDLHVVSQDLGTDEEIPLTTPATTETNEPITVSFPSSFGIGVMATYQVSVIDEAGAESATVTESVTFD